MHDTTIQRFRNFDQDRVYKERKKQRSRQHTKRSHFNGLQSNLYKLLASCLEKHLAEHTEEHQPVEQAGFRSTYSTIDHIQALEFTIEKYKEMKRSLYLAFIDYAKAFDSISHLIMWRALQECDVPSETTELIQDIYKKSTSRVILDKRGT
ncbi:unnamed protein product [Euphydryas editha]|uniref:Reverse transcriptase domain-containing protein n=1 Tax=Euphydryas editha TaxID=104508 RepID=A0AAU9URY5_EUPED|nr:unnamed protein product [Euphydryas editha]